MMRERRPGKPQPFQIQVQYDGPVIRQSFASADTARGRARRTFEQSVRHPTMVRVVRKHDGAVVLDMITGEDMPMERWYDGIEG
jgi:hypothetical protein